MTSRGLTPLLTLADHGNAVEKSVSDIAHILFFGFLGWPWLVRSLSGGKRRDKRALLDRLQLPHDALPHLGSWKADTGFLKLIADRIETARPKTVVELGAGASSLIIGRALQLHGDGTLHSYDQHAGFVDATRGWMHEHGIDAEMRAAPLGDPPCGWPGAWYQLTHLPERIDLLVIDGPPWSNHPFVRGAAESLFDRLPVGGMILLDDAARPGERIVARKWRERWPDIEFRLVASGTKGTLVGTRLR